MTRELVLVLVFVAGLSSMATEILLSRFLAPYYGSSLLIWTLVIFSILVSLSVGYLAGGRLADASENLSPLCRILQWAALALGGFPFALRLLLVKSLTAKSAVLPVLAIVLTILGFALPVVLMAMTGPFVIKILSRHSRAVGLTSGKILGVSTLGSILGTFLATYVLIPEVGTLRGLVLLGIALGAAAQVTHVTFMTRSDRPLVLVLPILVALYLAPRVSLRPMEDVVYERESVYNNIQVRQQTLRSPIGGEYWRRLLILNEGFAVHSIALDPKAPFYPLVGSVWDYMSLMPLLAPMPAGGDYRAAIVGLAGGTVAKGLVYFFKDVYKVRVEGAEIDPAILDVARVHFQMTEPEIQGFAQDGREFLRSRPGPYDMILTDAYRQPYIPFHLTTREYFELMHSKLHPSGFAMINCGASKPDDELLRRLQTTMKTVFKHVYILEVPRISPLFANYLVLGTDRDLKPASLFFESLTSRILALHPGIPVHSILVTIRDGLTEFSDPHPDGPLTDDQAPIEHMVDLVIMRTILDPSFTIPSGAR